MNAQHTLRAQILDGLAAGDRTSGDLSVRIGASCDKIRNALRAMERAGEVSRDSHGPEGTFWRADDVGDIGDPVVRAMLAWRWLSGCEAPALSGDVAAACSMGGRMARRLLARMEAAGMVTNVGTPAYPRWVALDLSPPRAAVSAHTKRTP